MASNVVHSLYWFVFTGSVFPSWSVLWSCQCGFLQSFVNVLRSSGLCLGHVEYEIFFLFQVDQLLEINESILIDVSLRPHIIIMTFQTELRSKVCRVKLSTVNKISFSNSRRKTGQ